jgi:hypothetical protein
MWPASINVDYLVSRYPTDLITSSRSVIEKLSPEQPLTEHPTENDFNLTFNPKDGLPIRCWGRVESTAKGIVIHVTFSSPLSFFWMVMTILIGAAVSFVGLCIWEPTMIKPWGILCAIMAVVTLLSVIFVQMFSLMGAATKFERQWIYPDPRWIYYHDSKVSMKGA